MLHERPEVEREILLALDATPPRVPVVLGLSGSGRTSVLRGIEARLDGVPSRYVDAERVLSTPERFLGALIGPDSSQGAVPIPADSPRAAFDALLDYISQPARPSGPQQPILLLDEFLELERLNAFPGLRGLLGQFLDAVTRSSNRLVLTSRYIARATRLLASLPANRFTVVDLPPLSAAEVRAVLAERMASPDDTDLDELAGVVLSLADGRPSYVHRIADGLVADEGANDPLSALAAQMGSGAPLATALRFTYELRLHRARGYSALKGVLATLADEEPLTLSDIARRLGRTPGSTKDYLLWLADVDLIAGEAKRYRFADPLLRLWVRLHCRPSPPNDVALAREVQDYAVSRLPPGGAMTPDDHDLPSSGESGATPLLPEPPVDLIEID
ncbi:MAG: hypothetical protein F4Y45_07030 [Acidobacteria bacterium]|nr:hypothetical protein [Acidobacteriota bacterium]MYD71987.1 hypothetical protein [Acidobacteriota bacterium]MYJ04983.1 hypothetical protein [Acidobacteriota bacterium]